MGMHQLQVLIMMTEHWTYHPRWWFQMCSIFTHTWGNDPRWRAYFSDGLKTPTKSDFIRIHQFLWRFNHSFPAATDEPTWSMLSMSTRCLCCGWVGTLCQWFCLTYREYNKPLNQGNIFHIYLVYVVWFNSSCLKWVIFFCRNARKRIAVSQAQGQLFALKLAEKLARQACVLVKPGVIILSIWGESNNTNLW